MRIISTNPAASNFISGVIFVNHGNAKVSEDVTEEVAQNFTRLPGFGVFEAGDEELTQVDKALEQMRANRAAEFNKPTLEKDKTIGELQDALRATQQLLVTANQRNNELEEENRMLKEQVGRPSMEWSKVDLIAYAEKRGLVISNAMNKSEILDMIENRAAQKG